LPYDLINFLLAKGFLKGAEVHILGGERVQIKKHLLMVGGA
jgi:hypothetical protein